MNAQKSVAALSKDTAAHPFHQGFGDRQTKSGGISGAFHREKPIKEPANLHLIHIGGMIGEQDLTAV